MPPYDLDLDAREAVPRDEGNRSVHVRINVGGVRIIGWVDLPLAASARCSSILNNADRYLAVRRQVSPEADAAETISINKEAISYVEVVGEPATTPWAIPGTFYPVVIKLCRPAATLHGELFVLTDTVPADVLNDERPFMSVRRAQFVNSSEAYSFLAVGKAQTEAVLF